MEQLISFDFKSYNIKVVIICVLFFCKVLEINQAKMNYTNNYKK